MEKQIKAFFYDYKYYLFPEDCASLDELKKKKSVTAMRLKEELCMAPDFIYESMAEETLEIEAPERLFEVPATLRTHEEYDEILHKQVDRVCHGCERYIDDGKPELNGHHREMSLNGACYERRSEDESWDFATCVEVFWYRISRRLDLFGSLIDKNNQKKINALFNKELSKFFFPVKVYGGVQDGKYCLMFAHDYNHMHIVRKILAYMAEVAAQEVCEMKKAGWEVFPCRQKGAYRYEGKTDFKKVKARIVQAEVPSGIAVELYSPKELGEKKTSALFQDLFDYLSGHLGEKAVQALVTECSVVSEDEGMTPVCELLPALEERCAEREEGGYPAPVYFGGVRGDGTENFPFREKITEGVTDCPDMTFLSPEERQNAWWLNMAQFFYLYVPRPAQEMGETVGWYLANGKLVPEPLRDSDSGTLIGGGTGMCVCGEDAFIIDCFVASEKSFYRALRIMAPVLGSLGAKLITVKEEGVAVYSCGYDFTLIENT